MIISSVGECLGTKCVQYNIRISRRPLHTFGANGALDAVGASRTLGALRTLRTSQTSITNLALRAGRTDGTFFGTCGSKERNKQYWN